MAELRGGILFKTESAIGNVDSSNTVFNTNAEYIPDSLVVFLNGIKQKLGVDYNETGPTTFEFVTPPIGDNNPDTVEVLYQPA